MYIRHNIYNNKNFTTNIKNLKSLSENMRKQKNRCIISNKIIDGREAILKDFAEIYVLKQGIKENDE